MIRSLHVSLWCAVIFTPLILLSTGLVIAQTMTGNSFQIESDSINMGGGFSDSDSFALEDTLGEVATGISESDSFELRAGYQQMQAAFISITQPDAVTLSPALSGIMSGVSNGSTTLTVTTDNTAGYEVLISAESEPAMRNEANDTIADYSPSGVADYVFTTSNTDVHFGYSVESAHAVSRFFHNPSTETCGTGSSNVARFCWDGLSSSPATIVESGQANHPNGTETTLHFRIGLGSDVSQPPGTYVATTTVTAVPL